MSDIETFISANSFGVAGASADREKYGNKVLRAYLQKAYSVVPIHPSQSVVEGQTAFPNLAAAPPIESLSIVTPPVVTEQLVREAIEAGVKHLWMQPGAESEAAVQHAQAAGLTVIAGGPCLLVVLGFRE
jgi:predicted CoA-binding protein